MPQFVRDMQFTPFITPYVEGATKEYSQLQERLRNDYDTAALQYDALQEAKDNMKKLSWKADDVAAANQIFDAASKEIQEAAETGDYENKNRLIRKAIGNFKQRYAPILANYEADIKQREEVMKFDKIKNPLERQRVYERLKELYNNVGQDNVKYDSQGNVMVTPYQTFSPAADANLVEKALKISEGWKADKNTTIPYKIMRNGIPVWEQKSIETASEQEIFNEAYKSLKSDPEVVAYLNQRHLVNDYDLNDYDAKTVQEVKQKYPSATDKQIGAMLEEHTMIQEAANTAAKKSGYVNTDFNYKFDPEWEAGTKAEAERKALAATVITTSTSSDYKIDLKGLGEVKNNLVLQKEDIQNKLKTATNPVTKEELQNTLNGINTKLRLQENLLQNAEAKTGWNWGTAYAEYAAAIRKQGKEGLISLDNDKTNYTPLSATEFKELVKFSPQGDFTNTALAGKYGIATGKLLAEARKNYSKVIEKGNENNSITQEHQLVEGNDHTYSGQYSKLLTNRFKNGNVEFITQAGQQLDINRDFAKKDVDLSTLNIIPTRDLIAGKPGFAVTGTKKDGTGRVTYYTVMDEGTSNIEDYQQNGYDLLRQANTSKYADAPEKRNQLRTTGLLQVGAATNEGRKLSELNLPTVDGGSSKNPVKLPLNNKLEVHVINEDGVNYYKLYNPNVKQYISNPEDGKTNFRSEEDLMVTLGTNNLLVSNPSILK